MPRTPADAKKKAQQAAFLAAYEEMGVVTYACKAAECGRSSVYQWADEDPEGFGKAMAEAREAAVDRLEQEATRRAVEGTVKPVFQGGERVGEIQDYSDTLLIFLLKAARPQRFRDRYYPTTAQAESDSASPATLDGLMERFEAFTASEAAQAYAAGYADAQDHQPAKD